MCIALKLDKEVARSHFIFSATGFAVVRAHVPHYTRQIIQQLLWLFREHLFIFNKMRNIFQAHFGSSWNVENNKQIVHLQNLLIYLQRRRLSVINLVQEQIIHFSNVRHFHCHCTHSLLPSSARLFTTRIGLATDLQILLKSLLFHMYTS